MGNGRKSAARGRAGKVSRAFPDGIEQRVCEGHLSMIIHAHRGTPTQPSVRGLYVAVLSWQVPRLFCFCFPSGLSETFGPMSYFGGMGITPDWLGGGAARQRREAEAARFCDQRVQVWDVLLAHGGDARRRTPSMHSKAAGRGSHRGQGPQTHGGAR